MKILAIAIVALLMFGTDIASAAEAALPDGYTDWPATSMTCDQTVAITRYDGIVDSARLSVVDWTAKDELVAHIVIKSDGPTTLYAFFQKEWHNFAIEPGYGRNALFLALSDKLGSKDQAYDSIVACRDFLGSPRRWAQVEHWGVIP